MIDQVDKKILETTEWQVTVLREQLVKAEEISRKVTDVTEHRKWTNTIAQLNRELNRTIQLHEEVAKGRQNRKSVTELTA
jgi:hypothetical protein